MEPDANRKLRVMIAKPKATKYPGDVAQLGERRPCKAEVVGSSPIVSTGISQK